LDVVVYKFQVSASGASKIVVAISSFGCSSRFLNSHQRSKREIQAVFLQLFGYLSVVVVFPLDDGPATITTLMSLDALTILADTFLFRRGMLFHRQV